MQLGRAKTFAHRKTFDRAAIGLAAYY